jgi:hypothetical protein
MSKYSNFEFENKKTRNEVALEDTLKEFKDYKNASQNFKTLDGRYFDDDNFAGVNTRENFDDAPPNNFFDDPRYNHINTRDESRKQQNNKKNLKMVNTSNGFNYDDDKFSAFQETNYEDPKFMELSRDLAVKTHKAIRGYVNADKLDNNSEEDEITHGLSSRLDKHSISDKTPGKKDKENDLSKIIKKVKGIPDDEKKPVLRMPNKKIKADKIKGQINLFKQLDEPVQDMISHALLSIWKDDFAMKKIKTYLGVKNFIIHNFKDKMNSFFVLLDDDGDFISTFAVDTENFAPYISHLYVNPNLRNKGFGKKSLKYAEKYIKKLGFDNSNLWSEEKLVPFYKKNGYNVDSPLRISEDKVVFKMVKNLSS